MVANLHYQVLPRDTTFTLITFHELRKSVYLNNMQERTQFDIHITLFPFPTKADKHENVRRVVVHKR